MSQRYIGGLIYNPPGGFSGYFDGSGDYLSLPSTSALAFGTGDFTVEMWIFPTVGATGQTLISNATSDDTQFSLQLRSTNKLALTGWNTEWLLSSGTVVINAWNHVVAVRSGTSASLFINGFRQANATVSNNFSSTNVYNIARNPSNFDPYTGYISNLRAVKGTAVYDPTATTITVPNGPLQAITNTSLLTCAYSTFRDGSTNNFTITVNGNTAVSTQNPFPLTTLPNPALGNQGNGVYSMSQYQSLLSQNLWPAVDPYWRYVTLMLHGNGTNGAQNNTFLDSSTNNFTITRNGNTTQGTFAPFGNNWSNYFDGTGDYITSSQSQTIPATGDFTIDGWFWCNTYTNYPSILSQGTSGNAGRFNIYINNDGKFGVQIGATANNIGSAVPTNQWVHFAVTRSGSTVTVYINGASIGTATNGTSVQNTTPSIGSEWTGDPYRWIGYLSNIRVSNVVRTISLPASPFVADANTVLLTCQSNRFIDTSTTAATLTPNGNVSVQRFSPFAPTAPYAAGTDGGSGYFDGSGDYLRVASNTDAALSLGTSDFTYEAWVYPTAFVSGSSVIGVQTQTNGSAGNGFALYLTNTGAPGVLAAASSGGYAVNFTGTAIPLNAWTHLAVTRSGNTFTLWRNGVSDGTATSSVTITQDSTSGYGGWNTGASPQTGQGHNGYIVDRLTKGGALYSATFTPPSSPFTTTVSAGTVSLLCSMTNAGIIDNAEMNNLETVGNAQISTAQSKFGGASMYFDGTGDYLKYLGTVTAGLGSGNFTIEFWINAPSLNDKFILGLRGGMSGSPHVTTGGYGGTTVGALRWASSAGEILSGTTVITDNTWHHCAIVRNGSTITLYVDGINRGSGTDTTSFNGNGGQILIGENNVGTNTLTGYLDDLRITKGYARYTANFTPQRSQWQDQ
jgi:hypothetical protein